MYGQKQNCVSWLTCTYKSFLLSNGPTVQSHCESASLTLPAIKKTDNSLIRFLLGLFMDVHVSLKVHLINELLVAQITGDHTLATV